MQLCEGTPKTVVVHPFDFTAFDAGVLEGSIPVGEGKQRRSPRVGNPTKGRHRITAANDHRDLRELVEELVAAKDTAEAHDCLLYTSDAADE